MAFDESAAFTPPAAFGPYRVLHQIGSGVLGPVFRTYDPQQDRLVAVKAFRLDVVPETVAKLADQLRQLPASAISSPAVVQVLDAGLEGMSAYLAMEYVSAETLDVALRHLAPAPLDRALPILVELAQAIEAAWAAGHGHGAIHPRDVFVLSGTNEIRLTGCGVVPALEAAGIKVPPRRPYAAPERGSAEAWDIRADVYSLGVLAHELLTKRRPGGAGDQDGSLVTGTSPEARVQIRRVLAAAMAERPDARFATPTAFTDALGAIARGEALGPLPEGANATAPVPEEKDEKEQKAEKPATSSRRVHEPPPLLAMAEEPEPQSPPAPSQPAPVFEPPPVAEPAPVVEPAPRVRRVIPAPTSEAPRTPPLGIRASPPPLRVSPPPVIVPVRAAFPWAAVIAAALASGTLFGVSGYWMGLRHRLVPAAPAAAATTADGANPSAAPGAGTDVVVPAPLVPGAGTAAPPTTAPPEPPKEVAKPPVRPAPATRTKPESTLGSLVIETRPAGARVVLDGKAIGVTPLTLPDLRVGSHPLRLERAGYKTLVTSVVIKSGERARVAVTLELSGVPGPWMPPSR